MLLHHTGMKVNSLHANLPLWRWLRMEEAPAAAANAGSELLAPTLIGSWKDCNVHFSGTHAGISTRLPSIYRVWQVLRRWLMMTLLRGLSRWQSMTPNLSLICTPYIHTNACTHVLFIAFLTQSSEVHHALTFCPQMVPPPPPPPYPVTTNQAPRWLRD